jgi:hypothetical protein
MHRYGALPVHMQVPAQLAFEQEAKTLFNQALCICFAACEALDIARPGGNAVARRPSGGYFDFVNGALLLDHAKAWLWKHAATIDAATKRTKYIASSAVGYGRRSSEQTAFIHLSSAEMPRDRSPTCRQQWPDRTRGPRSFRRNDPTGEGHHSGQLRKNDPKKLAKPQLFCAAELFFQAQSGKKRRLLTLKIVLFREDFQQQVF